MKIRVLIFAFFLNLCQISAQLNGTYTLGGTSPDYATFTDAVTALTSSGVSGPVTFNVRDGVYQEKIILPVITGTSATNRIIFQSSSNDSTSVVLSDSSSTASANNFTLQLNGADFVTFRKMTIRRAGTNLYGTVVNILNESQNNTFENSRIEGTAATTLTTNSCLFYSAAGTTSNDSGTVIRNNYLMNGSYGVYLLGASTTILEGATVISDNQFVNTYGRAVHLGNQNAPLIEKNVITTTSTYATFYGMYFTACNNNMIIRANKMSSPNGGYGLYFTGSNGSAGLPITIVNNFIHVGGTGTAYGMYFTASSNMNIWHNSINVSGTGATSRCFYATGTTTTKLVVQNNILANTGGGVTYYIATSALPALSISNYNDLYSSGSNLAYWSTGNLPNISTWRDSTGRDLNSVSGDPVFASMTDLHVFSGIVNNVGTPIAGVSTDIDGDARSMTTPDIGADEFSPLADNLVMLGVTGPAQLGSCGSPDVEFTVSIGNVGSAAQSNIPVQLDITGALTMSLYDTIAGPLAPNSTLSYTFTQSVNTTAGGALALKAFISLAGDQFRANDTVTAARNFYTIPNSPTVVSPQQGCDNNPHILSSPDPGNVSFWYDQPTGGNLLHIGDDFSPALSSDSMFYVEAREGGGSGGCLRIVETGIGGPDFVEIQNLSGATFDATGWIVAVSDNYTNINTVNTMIWQLGVFNPGEIQFREDQAGANYWGNNILWNPGNNGWAIIIDNNGNVVDFVAHGWTAADIQAMNTTIGGYNITISSEWSGNAPVSCATGSVSRIGNSDNNTSADFACEAETKGTQNINLSTAFANCGLGLCGSVRVPVQVNLVPGVTVSLGNDTALTAPVSYTLDAGAGFSAYEWSDGSTGSTLNINAPGTYWVTVTGANGCTFTDSINITIAVGISSLSHDDRLHVYPNPAQSQLFVEFASGNTASVARLTDMNGRIVREARLENRRNVATTSFDLNTLENGIYILQVINAEGVSVVKVQVQN